MYSRVNHTLRAKPSRLIIFLKREFPVNQLPPLNFATPMPKKTMDRSSAHSRNRSSNNHHPYYHQHLHQGHGRARPGSGSNSGRYPPGHHQAAAAATAGFPPPPPPPPHAPHLPPNPMMPPSDFPHPSHFWPPPPFDPHSMPPPGPGPGPMMGEPWFDPSMPVPPKGFNHFRHPYPPDHHPGHMGAPNYRGRGGNRGEGGGVYFNDVHNMAVPPVFDFSADGHSNSQLSNSDGMSAGGNIMIPPDHQMHREGSTMQSSACRSHAPLRPMVELNKPVQESEEGGGGGGEESATTVSVLSYNLLAQDLIRKNRYLYSDAVPELLEWDFRKTNLLKDLTESDADIFCLQEVQEDHYNLWFEPQLKEHGYTGVYQCRTGSHTDGCAVFYRTKSLELLEWKGLTYRQTFKVLNRDNVGIVLRFKFIEQQEQKGDGKEFCVATTHLLYNPKAGEVKLAQMSCLFAELHRMATIPGSGGLLPIVLCGDFNCTPNSPLVDFITSSFLNYSKMCATEVAGYNHRKSRSREIPSPLLPPSMNIGPNCIYMETVETDSTTTTTAINSTPTATANGMAEVAGGNDIFCKKEKRPHSSLSSSHGSSHQKEERGGQHEKAVASTKTVGASDAGDFVQLQNEGFKATSSSDGLSSKRYSKTRSARGAKARGMSYSGIKMSDFPSLTSGPKSTVKTSQSPSDGQPSSSSTGPRMTDDKKPPDSSVDIEGDVSTDDSDMDWERISTGDENQKSDTTALNSSTEAKPEPRSNSNSTGGRAVDLHTGQLSRSEPKKRSLCHIQGLITHPFKFITAYPQSRISTPSTVTTFHQSAFETVDYIFFTPPTKKRAGFHLLSRKALPSTHVLLDLGPQPHRYLSSDHLLLQACFQLVGRKTSRTN